VVGNATAIAADASISFVFLNLIRLPFLRSETRPMSGLGQVRARKGRCRPAAHTAGGVWAATPVPFPTPARGFSGRRTKRHTPHPAQGQRVADCHALRGVPDNPPGS